MVTTLCTRNTAAPTHLADEGQCVGATRFSGRRLRDHSRPQHDDTARAYVDFRDDLVSDVVLNPADFRGIVVRVGFHDNCERFAWMTGIQTHCDDTPRPYSCDARGGALDVGGIDVASGHDDHVF